MTRRDRTQAALIEKILREKTDQSKIGEVISVTEHTREDDNSNFECQVVIDGGTDDESIAAVYGPHTDAISVPKVGDKVIVNYHGGESSPAYIIGNVPTIDDRPPLGKAGIYREKYESEPSPAGNGDIYLTKYVDYDLDPSESHDYEPIPQSTLFRLAKQNSEEPNPFDQSNLPVSVEMYDSPDTDEAWVSVEINKVDGSDSDKTWGMKFNIKTGEFKIADSSGFGIESDGDGNFTWSHKTIKMKQESGSTGSINL